MKKIKFSKDTLIQIEQLEKIVGSEGNPALYYSCVQPGCNCIPIPPTQYDCTLCLPPSGQDRLCKP